MSLLPDALQNRVNESLFRLRAATTSRWALRRGNPEVSRIDAQDEERRYYTLLLEERTRMPRAESLPSLVVDVGCRNWSYLGALAHAFPQARLLGVEVDGGRRYWNLYRRMDYARAHAATVPGGRARFVAQDFRTLQPETLGSGLGKGDSILFTFFYPFVSPDPCLGWGLPASRFADYGELLRHARNLSDSLGSPFHILSAHQGEWEAEIARHHYKSLGFSQTESVIKPERFHGLWPAPHDVHLILTLPEAHN